GTSNDWKAPSAPPRQTLTSRTSRSKSGGTSGAFVEPRQDELPVPERLGRGQPPVGGAEHALEELVARLVGRELLPEEAGDVDVDVLGHGAHRARVRA